MCNQHQCGVVFSAQPEHQVDNPISGSAIEVAGGLISKQNTRCNYKSASDSNSLLFTTG